MRSDPHEGAHLSDDQLMETYVLTGDSRHLTACPECRARYDELAGALEQIRGDAVREADAVFTAERLHEQRDRILRRLERQGHLAEVLMFPRRSGSQQAGAAFARPCAAMGRRRGRGRAGGGLVPRVCGRSPCRICGGRASRQSAGGRGSRVVADRR